MSATHTTNDPNAEAEIRELFETRTRALASKDAATLAAANDAAVVVFDAVAPFVHRGAQTTNSGTMLDGTEVGMWVRATSCLRKLNNGWKIVHEHASVPFDGDTGKAVVTGDLDL